MRTKLHKIILGSITGLLTLANVSVQASSALATDAPTYRGKIILIVDKTMARDIQVATRLDRLAGDLAGDGWRVLRHDVERGPIADVGSNPNWSGLNGPLVRQVRAMIKADYDAAPTEVKAVLLIGRVPIPYSGTDGGLNGNHYFTGCSPGDVFYGDMTSGYGILGGWTDQQTSILSTAVSWRPQLDNLPGDGKFDQNNVPAPMKLAVGRIDFSNMGIFEVNETTMLSRYLDKDHDFRLGVFAPHRGALVNQISGDLFKNEVAASLGADNVNTYGQNQWFSSFTGVGSDGLPNDYLIGGVFGTGDGNHIDGYLSVPDFVTTDSRAVFVNLRCSWSADWDADLGLLKSTLANAYDPANGKFGYGLTCLWGDPDGGYWGGVSGINADALNKRLLGTTIGEAMFIGQSPNVNVTLMGDPSLRLHNIRPPGGVSASISGSTVALSWTASPDAATTQDFLGTSTFLGYNIYRAPTRNGPFTLVNTGGPVTGTSYSAARPTSGDPDNYYMVRTAKQDATRAGNYMNMSDGGAVKLPGYSTPYISIANGPANEAVVVNTQDNVANSAAFSVDALGTDVSGDEQLMYQWYKDNVALPTDDVRIKGADTASLLIKNVQPSDAGNYKVVVFNIKNDMWNNVNSLTSGSATLTVVAAVLQASPDGFQAYRDMPLDLDVLANDSAGVSGAALSIVSVSGLSNPLVGTISINSQHNLIHYVPSRTYLGTFTFSYVLSDGVNQQRGEVTVNVTSNPINQPPVISAIGNQQLSARSSVTIPFSVTDDFTEPDNLIQTISCSDSSVYLDINGSGSQRTIQISSIQSVSDAIVTLKYVDEDNASSTRTFHVAISAYSDVPAVSGAVFAAPVSGNNTFSFSASGSANSTWIVYSSTDLKNWTADGSVTMNSSGVGSYSANVLSSQMYKFFKLSDGTYASQAIGFERVNVPAETDTAHPGQKLIADQLIHAGDNSLATVFAETIALSTSLNGVQVQKWSGNTWVPYTYSSAGSGSWSGSTTMNPGEGAKFVNPTANQVMVTFVGLVPEGALAQNMVGGGLYDLVASVLPRAGGVKSVLGYNPVDFDSIMQSRSGAYDEYQSFIYDTTLGANPDNWYQGDDATPADEPVVGVGESLFVQPADANETWAQSYSAAGGIVPALSGAAYTDGSSASTFSYNISGTAGAAWTVYSSTDLKNWTAAGIVTLDGSGAGTYTDNLLSSQMYKFYRLSDGTYTSHAIGFERVNVPAATDGTHPGQKLIADQLIATDNGGNTLANVFAASLPDGVQVQKWSVNTWVPYTYSSAGGGSWSGSTTMNPGEGAKFVNPTANQVMVTFVGLVPEGALAQNMVGGGLYDLVASVLPKAGGVKSVLGYNPADFDSVMQLRSGVYDGYQSFIYDSTLGTSPNNWYQGDDATPADEPVVGVGESMFVQPAVDHETWVQSYSAAGGNVPALTEQSIAAGSFIFTASGAASTTWTVYSSTDLENWTAAGSVTLDGTGSGSYTDSTIGGQMSKFYKLSDGMHTTHAIGFERVNVPAATDSAHPGQKLIADQLIAAGGAGNTVASVFATSLPDGVQVQKWIGNTWVPYTYTSTGGGSWSGSTTMNPGEGAKFVNPTVNQVTVTFVGLVPEGAWARNLTQNQNNLIASVLPKAGGVKSVLGYNPVDFDSVMQLRSGVYDQYQSFIYDSTLGTSPNNWYQGDDATPADEPVVGVGEAMFIQPAVDHELWVQSYSPVP